MPQHPSAMARLGWLAISTALLIWSQPPAPTAGEGAAALVPDVVQAADRLQELMQPFSLTDGHEMPGCSTPDQLEHRRRRWFADRSLPVPELDCREVVSLLTRAPERWHTENSFCQACELLTLACRAPSPLRMNSSDELSRSVLELECARRCAYPARCPLQEDRLLKQPFEHFGQAARQMIPSELKPNLERLVNTAAALAIQYPQFGSRLGFWLDSAITGALEACGPDPGHSAVPSEFQAWRSLLVEFDHNNISGPSHFQLARNLWKTAMANLDPRKQIDALRHAHGEVRTHLEQGSLLLQDKSRVWSPFKEYSDALYEAYTSSLGEPLPEDDRSWLIETSTLALRRGIQLYLQSAKSISGPDEKFVAARTALHQRVIEHTSRLQRDLNYAASICYASTFLTPGGLFTEQQAARVHALLASAHYLLNGPWEGHLKQSGNAISRIELEELKQDIGELVTLKGIRPCATQDW